jgi:hypothetical protein
MAAQERLRIIELRVFGNFEVQSFESSTFVNTEVRQMESGFSGLVVSMLASGTQDRGFEPG